MKLREHMNNLYKLIGENPDLAKREIYLRIHTRFDNSKKRGTTINAKLNKIFIAPGQNYIDLCGGLDEQQTPTTINTINAGTLTKIFGAMNPSKLVMISVDGALPAKEIVAISEGQEVCCLRDKIIVKKGFAELLK